MRRFGYVIALGLMWPSVPRAQELQLKIIALNDLHGNLESPGKFRVDAQSPAVPVGGADFLAGYVAHLKAQNPFNVVVSAGDLTGGGPQFYVLKQGTGRVVGKQDLEAMEAYFARHSSVAPIQPHRISLAP